MIPGDSAGMGKGLTGGKVKWGALGLAEGGG